MRSLVYAVAFGALLAATSAQAAVSLDFTGNTSSSVWVVDPTMGTPITGGGALGGFAGTTASDPVDGLTYGSSASSVVKITNSSASFTSGVASRGPAVAPYYPTGGSATATSGVIATVTNSGSGPVVLKSISSDIIQAGMGFMVQDPDPNLSAAHNNTITGYGVSPTGTFADFYTGQAVTLGTVSFSFNIYGPDYAEASDVPALFSVSGSLTLSFDAEGNLIETPNFDNTSILNDFSPVYANDSDQIAGYEWNETAIDVDLQNILLGAGDSTNLYYVATSSVDITSSCLLASDGVSPECIVGYSGFGDPVGRGGGITNFSLLRSFDSPSNTCPNNDTQICFSPQTITPFSNLITGSPTPEPATWAILIAGFGLTGAALRRRRVLSYS